MALRRVCSSANAAFLPARRLVTHFSTRQASRSKKSTSLTDDEIEALLSKPSWSVRTLLPSATSDTSSAAPEVSSKQLSHLLRLSALPPPRDAEEERQMLQTLSSQLHFVKAVQQVDTQGVKPLRSLRDETSQGSKERTYNMASMQDVLEEEEVIGEHHKRIRRKPLQDDDPKTKSAENWNVLGHADKTAGPFFIVEGAPREE